MSNLNKKKKSHKTAASMPGWCLILLLHQGWREICCEWQQLALWLLQGRSHRRAVGCTGSDLLPVQMCQQQGAPTRREWANCAQSSLSLSLSLCLRLSQGPFGLLPAHQTEICVSYKYITSAGGCGVWLGWENLEWVQGREKGKRHLTFPALERTVLTSGNKSLDLFNSLIWLMPHHP